MKFILNNYILLIFIAVVYLLAGIYPAQATKFSKEYFYHVDIPSVYDGDTFTAKFNVWIGHTVTIKIRMLGIDTPEKSWRGKCDKEKALAITARRFLKKTIDDGIARGDEIYITEISKDKYAGRVLARLMIGNIDVSKLMIANGYAVEYWGKGTKKDWCK